MKRKNSASGVNTVSANKAVTPVTSGKHRRSYYVAITQAEQNGTTTIEEIRVLPKELYSPERAARAHDSSAYDAAISNLYRTEKGFQLSVDRGPGFFQTELPPTAKEIAKFQEMLQTWSIDSELKGIITQDLNKQAAVSLSR